MSSEDPAAGRGRTVAVIAGLGVLGLLAGLAAGTLVDRAGGDDARIAAPAPVARATTAAPAATAGGALPSSSSTDYSPLPEHPESVGADFGYISKVTGSATGLTIVFDRAQFLTGDAAKKANGGHEPPDDYLIENTNTLTRTFGIAPKAALVGTARLNGESGEVKREVLSADVFLGNLQDALAADGKVAVWLRHTNGVDGDVTALSEQYVP